MKRTYIAIDLKSFYASVECVERGLDPLTTNLVVADTSRTDKTICLAVTPSLKAEGVPGRGRVFEVNREVRRINQQRRLNAPGYRFHGRSMNAVELAKDPGLELDYIAAIPQMKHYIDVSAMIYKIYLKYVAPEDIHVYSIDEVFIDATAYLSLYKMTAHDFTSMLIHDVLSTTGITATAGIGTNLYLCKIAMDITAKHLPADADGVRIAELDEYSFREKLWDHTPLTDFWRIGNGTVRRLAELGLYTMGDIARCSLGGRHEYYNEDLLYKKFGINAELLIDHAWGYESCTMQDVKAYRSKSRSLSFGQILKRPYEYEEGRIIVKEMADQMALSLFSQGLLTDQLGLYVGYDATSLGSDPNGSVQDPTIQVRLNHNGKPVPKEAKGSINLSRKTLSAAEILEALDELYDQIVDHRFVIRGISVCANRVYSEAEEKKKVRYFQLDLFTDHEQEERTRKYIAKLDQRNRQTQQFVLDIKTKYGKNAILRGMSLYDCGTAVERNRQVGGHRA